MSTTVEALTPVQCRATAKRTGERCRAWAIRGAKVCRVHGGMAGQVQRKAAERVALAEQMAAAPHRHPAEVLLDALHAADVLMRQQLKAGASSPEEVTRAIEMIERAQRFARSTMQLGLAERQQRVHEHVATRFVALIDGVLSAAELSPSQEAAARLALLAGLEEMVRSDDAWSR